LHREGGIIGKCYHKSIFVAPDFVKPQDNA